MPGGAAGCNAAVLHVLTIQAEPKPSICVNQKHSDICYIGKIEMRAVTMRSSHKDSNSGTISLVLVMGIFAVCVWLLATGSQFGG